MRKPKSSIKDSYTFEVSKLIAGHLTGSLTLEEEERFAELIKSSPRLQEHVLYYTSSENVQKRIDYLSEIDIESALLNVYSRRIKKPRSVKSYFPYAAVFAGFLLIALLFLQSKKDPRIINDIVYGYENDVLPGEEKAQLFLSDGTVVELGSRSKAFTESDGARLTESNGELSYFSDSSEIDAAQCFNKLVVPEAGTFRLVLADGTKVWLNANSKIEYPTRFLGDERTVKLTGEAYFEVAHNPAKPFKVKVNDNIITALGTSFIISAYEKNRLMTTLISGKVSAQSGLNQTILEPGKRLLIDKGAMRVVEADVEKELAWKNGYFSFHGESFFQAMEQIGRWYGVTITFRGDIKNEQIGGSISRSANLSDVVEMLKEVSNLTFEIKGKELLVIKN